MNEKTLRALVEAGAVKSIRIIANGAYFHIEADTPNGPVMAEKLKGGIKTWGTLDSAAKWVRGLGFGKTQVDLAHWQPGQKSLTL